MTLRARYVGLQRKGSVLMEFILVCPLLVILVSMLLQFSQIWIAREITAYAAYCACRAVLSANSVEEADGARRAAEQVCAWMCLAGLPGSTSSSSGGSETVDMPKFHDRDDIGDSETVYFDDGAGVKGELRLPGWGSIPGSDSVSKRVNAKVYSNAGWAVVKVEFNFPLMLPLAGRMISWFVGPSKTSASQLGRAGEVDYGSHELSGGNNPGWSGQETIMDENGNLVDRTDANWGSDGRYPAITLTEYCVLPRPYSSENLPGNAFSPAHPKVGGGS